MSRFVRKTEVEAVEGGFIVRFVGPVDRTALDKVGESLPVLAGRVSFDFRDVPFVDEAGLQLLAEAARSCGVRPGNCPPCVAALLGGPPEPRAAAGQRGSRRFEVAWAAVLTARHGNDLRWYRFAVRDAGMGGLRLEAATSVGATLVRGSRATIRLQVAPLDLHPIVVEARVVYVKAPGVVGVEIVDSDPETIRRYLALLAASCPPDHESVAG